jgi:ribonuclease kappa
MIFCGKKLSICCALLSVWGILQLTLMGVWLYSHSVAFAEDLEIHLEPNESLTGFFTKAWAKYESAVSSSWSS